MRGLRRDGTAEPVSRDQFLRRERGQENVNFPCSAATTSRISDDHPTIHLSITDNVHLPACVWEFRQGDPPLEMSFWIADGPLDLKSQMPLRAKRTLYDRTSHMYIHIYNRSISGYHNQSKTNRWRMYCRINLM